MRGVPGDEHPAHAVVLSLLAFGQEPRAPAHIGHAVVLARDAVERVAYLVQRDRLLQRRLFTKAVPRDGAEPAVAERDHQHGPALVGDTGQRVLRRPSEVHVGEQDVGFVLLALETDPDQLPHSAVRARIPRRTSSDGRAVGAPSPRRRPGSTRPPRRRARPAPRSSTRICSTCSVPLRDDQQHPESGRQLAQVKRAPPGGAMS